ncbi:uncharacterized protein LOC111043570 [Nilaparvata lugens]|uniref:uncharacterized protein LOC111043570 n=1 Tax=Nilaparvata lugens TaxID=108931 RepID=UPI00193E5322|nr:uncharacterized protein LOC111043570 [Nilaparvata lugens]
MIFYLAEIARYFKNKHNTVDRGEVAVNSNHVLSIDYDVANKRLKGVVQASIPNKTYNVMIDYDAEMMVQNAECSCTRERFKCHHIAALMIYAFKHMSATATSGHAESSTTEEDTLIRVEDIFPKIEFQPFDEPLSDEAIKEFKENLEKSGMNIGFTWLLSDEPEPDTGTD